MSLRVCGHVGPVSNSIKATVLSRREDTSALSRTHTLSRTHVEKDARRAGHTSSGTHVEWTEVEWTRARDLDSVVADNDVGWAGCVVDVS